MLPVAFLLHCHTPVWYCRERPPSGTACGLLGGADSGAWTARLRQECCPLMFAVGKQIQSKYSMQRISLYEVNAATFVLQSHTHHHSW